MNTQMEPLHESLAREENQTAGGSAPIFLWLIAVVCVVSAFVLYHMVSARRVDPPPPPVDVKSITQVNQTIFKLIGFMSKENWDEAQKMLSADAQKRLADANQTFKASILAGRKGKSEQIIDGSTTPEEPILTDTSVTHSCVLYFDKMETMYVPIKVIKETVNNVERLAIDGWGEELKPSASPSPNASASASPAASTSPSAAPTGK